MIKSYLRKLKHALTPKAMVLMYHRVAEPDTDVWDIAVSPMHFEQHLQILKNRGGVIPLAELAQDFHQKTLKRNSIAISFDDGYADNFETARPLLEKYALPATFFITNGNIGKECAFWWDELEDVFLSSERLPSRFSMYIGGDLIGLDLVEETVLSPANRHLHHSWKADLALPPTKRSKLFLSVWQKTQFLPETEQKRVIEAVRQWAGLALEKQPVAKSMTAEQLLKLSQLPLFNIGAHTVSHPALTSLDKPEQLRELLENKAYLEATIGKEVSLVAYPYGKHNGVTLQCAQESGFSTGFTTKGKVIQNNSTVYGLGRFQVPNVSGEKFQELLQQWSFKF